MGALNCYKCLNQYINEETEIQFDNNNIINDTQNIIRNENLQFLPQIEIYFNKQNTITKDNILQFNY